MAQTQAARTQSLDEFVVWQQCQPERWEFFQGFAYAMAGASNAHVNRLGADGHWVLFDFAGAPAVELTSVAASVPVGEVFEDLNLSRV